MHPAASAEPGSADQSHSHDASPEVTVRPWWVTNDSSVITTARATPTQNAMRCSPCHDSGQWLATTRITMSRRNTAVTRDHAKDNPKLR